MNLQIELTNQCNLRCIECPQRLMKRPRQYMSDEVFTKLLEDYIIPLRDDSKKVGHPPTLILHKDGEPLLHPHILDYIIRIAAFRPDTKIDLYTNGILMNHHIIDTLSRLQIKIRILVSFHFFDNQGRRVDYQHVDSVLTHLGKTRWNNMEIIFVSHINRFCNEEFLLKWKEEWKAKTDYKIEIHVNPHINPWTGLISEDNCVKFDACPYGDMNHIFFGVTGNVLACCMDLEEQITFGNIMTDRKEDIMERVAGFYDMVNRRDVLHPLCRRCLQL